MTFEVVRDKCLLGLAETEAKIRQDRELLKNFKN